MGYVLHTQGFHISMIVGEDSILNSLGAITSLLLFLDYKSSVYFHNYLRSLNSRQLTSLKLWKENSHWIFFCRFWVTDAKYNGKENENQSIAKQFKDEAIINKFSV